MRPITPLLFVLVGLLLSPVLAGDATQPDLPRYALTVGRKLVYSTTANSTGSMSMSSAGTLQVIVLHDNTDGSKRIVLRRADKASYNNRTQPERVLVTYVDLFPTGRTSQPMSPEKGADLTALPRLPATAAELANGWSDVNEPVQKTTTYTAQPSAAGELIFKGVEGGLMSKIYAITQEATVHFDRVKGVVTLVEFTGSQDYGFHIKNTGTIKLESDETVPADKLAAMSADYNAFFTAQQQYQDKMSQAEKSPAQADALIADAKTILDHAQAAAKSDDMRAELARMQKNHDEEAKYTKESASQFEPILNKPSPDWSTTDLAGKPVKLADFRGKVVVMDFWYRGCGWCMYATPQVKQLAADYKDKPVAVLGMNTDGDAKDAQFVVDAMGLTYPTIRAGGIPEKYGIQGFPTLIILDADGVVRDVHVGYSPTLRKDVGAKVDELLAGKKD